MAEMVGEREGAVERGMAGMMEEREGGRSGEVYCMDGGGEGEKGREGGMCGKGVEEM